jgi:hypothetical protein
LEQKMKALPQTDSISELAAFWDEHDLTEFEDEMEEVQDAVFVGPEQLVVSLCSEDARVVHEIAAKRRVSEAELVSAWIHERLRSA